MSFKKKYLLIMGGFTFIIGIIVINFMIKEGNSFQEREEANSYCIDNMDTNTDKDSLYYNYIIEEVAETIKDNNGVKDCKINVNYSDDEIVSANVSIAVENNEINISETNILDYVSRALEISAEDIVVSYD